MKRFLSLATILAITSTTFGGPIDREGDGERRTQLNSMEAMPFPAAALDAIDFQPAGVTLFVTISQVSPKSLLKLRRFDRLEERFGEKGLSIVGVVDEASWETISARKDAGLIKAELVLDRGGVFRELMLCDEDPDVYVMDRALQLRYADVTSESAVLAVVDLLDESAKEASGELARRQALIDAGEDPYATAKAASPKDIPASAYASANWPRHNTGGMSALDRQGKKLSVPLGSETWISKKDREPAEHVLVLDFWATWCGPCIRAQPKLVSLQKKFNDDLMVLAIGGTGEDLSTVKRYVAQHPKPYYNLFDGKQTVSNSLQVRGIPHTVVISTDGVIRWQGNPLSSDFEKIVADVIKADPFIAAKNGNGKPSASAGESNKSDAANGSTKASAYASQKWPGHNGANLNAKNMQGQQLDNLFEGVEWLDGDAPETEGMVTIVDFWATWCGPCIAFSPTLDAVQRRFKDDVVAVGYSSNGSRESRSNVVSHIEEHPVSYRHAFSEDRSLNGRVGVSAIPHVLILSSDGVVRWQGFPGGNDFQGIVTKVVIADRKARKAAAGE